MALEDSGIIMPGCANLQVGALLQVKTWMPHEAVCVGGGNMGG
jgi:hypothetical protein